MANKALSKRQKLIIRAEPARQATPRKAFSTSAKQLAAGPRQTTVRSKHPAVRHTEKQSLSEDTSDKD